VKTARFLEKRSTAWDRLEELVERVARHGLRKLSGEELHELTRLYRAVAVDVARARMYGIAERTQRRLNRIVIAAHGILYRRPRAHAGRAVWRFFSRGYPRLFRRLWAYWALALAVFLVAGLSAYVSVLLRPSNVHLFVPGCAGISEGGEELTEKDIAERFRALPRPPMAAGIMANNISVAFNAFALGITAGIGTCYVLLLNAVMLGGLAAHFANHGASYPFWSFILPHGILEILAILIAGAGGIRVGMSLALPGCLSRRASLRVGAKEAVLLVLGTAPMFVVAAFIEGYVTPSGLGGGLKIAVGLVAGGAALGYLALVGRSTRREAEPDVPTAGPST